MHHVLRYPVFLPFAILLMETSESSARGDLEAVGRGDGPFTVAFLFVATIALALLTYDLFLRPTRLGQARNDHRATGQRPRQAKPVKP